MSITSRTLHLGACYITTENELRRIVEFDGNSLCYVVRGRMAYPSWDKQQLAFDDPAGLCRGCTSRSVLRLAASIALNAADGRGIDG